jgi:uncharacterized phage-associated protein
MDMGTPVRLCSVIGIVNNLGLLTCGQSSEPEECDMAITTAKIVAAHLIAMSRERSVEITNLKLQKLLYYSQAWHLAFYDSPLFDDRLEAWVHGPVVPPIFGDFKHFRWNPIDVDPMPLDMPELEHGHLREIMKVYGDLTPNQLEERTHQEWPWKEARGNTPPDEPSKTVISLETMKQFYRSQMNG